MKIYLIDNENMAKQLCQLLKLDSECSKLRWSQSIKDVPKDVIDALDCIEAFIEETVYMVCTDKNLIGSLTENEESEMIALFNTMPELRSTLGTGVIMAGEEAQIVARALCGKKIPDLLASAISSSKNVILV